MKSWYESRYHLEVLSKGFRSSEHGLMPLGFLQSRSIRIYYSLKMPPKRKIVSIQKSSPNTTSLLTNKKSKVSAIETQPNVLINDNDVNLRIISWNVNGIRAAIKNGIMEYLESMNCDILCLQETKCNDKNFPKEIKDWKKFQYQYFKASDQDGYAGVALFSASEPNKVTYGIGSPKFDCEGRIITAFFDKFILINAYFPNAGQNLKRLDYKLEFNQEFLKFLLRLNSGRPIILCGDLNVAHKEIDLENPKTNTKTAGFTIQERQEFTKLLDSGFIDSFRLLYPDRLKSYTYWGYRFNCRAKDIGWRLDYFVISERLKNNLIDNKIDKEVMGSDHCPIILLLSI